VYPTLFHLPALHLEVRSYQVMLVLAVVVCHWLAPRWAMRHEAIEPRTTRWVLGWMGVAAFAGGRAQFVINAWSFSTFPQKPWEVLAFWQGLHAGGALLALVVSTPIILKLYGLQVGRFADALAPTIGVGIALARLGCFLNGCCYGTPCSGAWCVVFPRESYPHVFHLATGVVPAGAIESAPVHPIQLYWAVAGLLATAAALWAYRRKRYHGHVALVALAVYLTAAAAAEPFRAQHYGYAYLWWGRLQFEWIAIAMAVAAVMVLAAAELAARRRAAGEVVGRQYVVS
jgi:phosphatidylglycerol---prolipoprotein diacylglyceryl transferase